MDAWLEDDIKEMLAQPCLHIAATIGRRLDNRIKLGQEIDERALTEFIVDSFDSGSDLHVWGNIISLLRQHRIYLNTTARKSTIEHRTGADIGLTPTLPGIDPFAL